MHVDFVVRSGLLSAHGKRCCIPSTTVPDSALTDWRKERNRGRRRVRKIMRLRIDIGREPQEVKTLLNIP